MHSFKQIHCTNKASSVSKYWEKKFQVHGIPKNRQLSYGVICGQKWWRAVSVLSVLMTQERANRKSNDYCVAKLAVLHRLRSMVHIIFQSMARLKESHPAWACHFTHTGFMMMTHCTSASICVLKRFEQTINQLLIFVLENYRLDFKSCRLKSGILGVNGAGRIHVQGCVSCNIHAAYFAGVLKIQTSPVATGRFHQKPNKCFVRFIVPGLKPQRGSRNILLTFFINRVWRVACSLINVGLIA